MAGGGVEAFGIVVDTIRNDVSRYYVFVRPLSSDGTPWRRAGRETRYVISKRVGILFVICVVKRTLSGFVTF